MKIMKALVSFTDAHLGKVMKCDVIIYEGKHWLVSDWLENYATGKMKPIRIILLDSLPHQKIEEGKGPADFVINNPIPVCIMSGKLPEQTAFDFQIIEDPEIEVDIPKQSRLH